MRVVIICKYARDKTDGQATRHYFFAKHLVKLGHSVLLIKSRSNLSKHTKSFFGLYQKTKEGNLEIITINGPIINSGFSAKRIFTWLQFEWRLFRISKFVRNWKPTHIIVSSLSLITGLTGIRLKRKLSISLIFEVRDIYPLTLVELGKLNPNNILVKILSWIEHHVCKNSDALISTLENFDKYLREILPNSKPCHWIPSGYENDWYDSKINEETATYKKIQKLKSLDKFIIAYAGTIGLANQLSTILDSARVLEKTHPNIHFVMIGEGPEKQKLESQYPLSNISFLESVPKEQLPLYLSLCDVLIHSWKKSSLYRFGISPNKWNEYMYSARPMILAHDYTSRIFNQANCGWQVPAEDTDAMVQKIIEVMELNKKEISQLGQNGKRYLEENLSYQQHTQTLIDIINKK